MTDELRPDRSGLLVFVSFVREPRNCFEGVSLIVRMLPGSTAIADGTAGRVLDLLRDRLLPFWFSDGSRQLLMHPENDVAQHVIMGTRAPPHLQEEVRAWRGHYKLPPEGNQASPGDASASGYPPLPAHAVRISD